MKVICISCFGYYVSHFKQIIEFYNRSGFKVRFIISDFDHNTKKKYTAKYPDTVQLKVPAYKRNISLRRLYSHYIFSKKVYKELCRYSPDIVFVNIPPNSLCAQVIRYKLKYKAKIIINVWDRWPESLVSFGENALLAPLLRCWQKLRDNNIIFADLICCVSNETMKQMDKIAPSVKKIVLLPNREKKEAPAYHFDVQNQIDFCFLGNVNHILDIDYTAALLCEINKAKKTVLHIIGRGQNLEALTSVLEKVGVEAICHGVSFDNTLKSRIFSKCAFGINLPREETDISLSLKSVEYFQMGLPVISRNCADTDALIRQWDAGLFIGADNINGAAAKIISVSHRELADMHNNCLQLYEEIFENPDLSALVL